MRSASKALDGQPTIASNSAADVPETAHSHGSAPPVAMKSPVASQSPQYYVKAVSNSANPATWDLYEGFMENGKEHGLGRYTWADSESLLCTWNQGRCREKENREAQRRRQSTRQSTQLKQAEILKNGARMKKKNSACFFCVFCTNPTSADNCECLNCRTSWCSKCEKQWKWAGYRNRRPPCHCIIAKDGLATKSSDQAVQKGVIEEVVSHHFKRRPGIATVNDTILMVRCKNAHGAFLCDIGRLNGPDRTHLIEQETVRSYIKNCKPQPVVFMQLEKSWTLPPEIFPVAMNSKHLGVSWNPNMFTMARTDVDSLTINNFRVTEQSIQDRRLARILGRAQIDVGTAWTSVKPPKNYHIVCSPRPVVMVYCEESQENEMKQFFAEQLGADTFSTFIPSKDSHSVFCQAAASVDVETLFTVWLKVVRKFRSEGEEHGISPMELLHIVFHGWKSDPDFIIDPFEKNGMYHACKKDCAEFSASYDIAHKYVAKAHTDILKMAKRDRDGISKVQIPIFGPEQTIPGFRVDSKSVWSMFGPLAGDKPVGSIKLDRTDPQNTTSLPVNVKRIKIYSSAVNLTKNIMGLSGVNVCGLTHKRLKYQGKKVAEYLNELVLNWQKHAQVLMSFRIECTWELSDTLCNLRDLKTQHTHCQNQLLQAVSATTAMSLIALSDIDSLCRWCLKKFMRLSAGDDKKKFHDDEMATDMLLSLWHTMGYHHLARTQHKHARFLIDLNMQNVDMNSSENQPTNLLKTVLPPSDFNWSDEPKTSSMLQALTYMNVGKFKKSKQEPDTFVFRYMYKKICTATTNGPVCPWCYSSKKMLRTILRKLEDDDQENTHATMTACRSKNFETPIELALDVQARLQHHLHVQSCNPSQNNWDINNIQNVIASLFFKCTKKDKHNQNQEVIREIQLKMPIKGNAAADNAQIHTGDLERGESQNDHVDLNISELFRDEFDSIDEAVNNLCGDMQITCGTVPSEWITFFKQAKQTFIKLSDCVYASKRFAKGNATCHFAWNPKTKKPMCIKLISDTNTHEKEILTKLMQHTGDNPGQYNIVKYFGQEVRQHSICLKFEFVHPNTSFKMDLNNITYPQVVTYMRQLLIALDSLHNKYRITHSDIKPENFVHHFQTNTFRLIDFGSAVYSDNNVSSVDAGTRGFKAPELLQQSHGKKDRSVKRQPCIDIWSAGIILMSLLTGKKDILSRNEDMATIDCNKKHFDEIGNIVGKQAMKDVNMTNWTQYSDGCKEGEKTGWAAKALQLSERSWIPNDDALDLLSQMLNVCPRKRITSDAALKHRFFRSKDLLNNDGASEEEIIHVDDNYDHSKSPNMSATGLPNGKHWCYLNAVLQCLRQATELTKRISSTSKTYQHISNDVGSGIAYRLRTFLTSNDESQILQELFELRRQLRHFDTKFDGNSNECASEVCRTMLNAMLTAHCPTNNCQFSPAQVAQYVTKATMKCRTCNTESEGSNDEGTVISMALASDNTLQSSIQAWLQHESLPGVICDCGAKSVDIKWNLDTAPDVIIISLNTNYSREGSKLLNTAESGDTVDVDSHSYEIFAVVSHIGQTRKSGHYIAHTKRNGIWHCFDDSIVTRDKHWLSAQQQHETPCIFFLRKLPREEIQQCQTSQKNAKALVAGKPNVETISPLIADEAHFEGDASQNDIHEDLTLLIGLTVLARRDARSQWSPAFVQNGNDNECQVVFWTGREERHTVTVTAKNIKKMDWKYWNEEMKSWTGDEFDEAMDRSNIQADAQGNIFAHADLEIGVVVAKRNGLNAFTDEDGSAESKQQCNAKLWSVENDNCSFSSKPNKAVFLVTTKRVQRGEKLAWFYKSQSTLCSSEDKVVVTSSVASNEGACTGNSDSIKNKESQGQDNEPNIMQSIMFSMQGDTRHPGKSFDVKAYMDLWELQAPLPKTRNITISGKFFESKDFGSSIKPFLHQATIDLLLKTDITNWLDIDANNSFVIHLAMAMNKNPLALHTMFARNCSRNKQAKQDHVWIPDVLTAVLPSNLHFKIMILSRKPDDDTYTSQLYGSALHDAAEISELSAVLVRDGKNYSWLPGIRIHDVPVEKVQQNCQYSDCVEWDTMTKKGLFIQGCNSSKSGAPSDWINGVWNSACTKVGLLKADSGKWEKKPWGFNKDLSFQDGSLTPKSFEQLRDFLSAKVNCETVADLGSEAGHAVAQFAFMPFVKQVIGIEIQYSWAAYSAIILNHLQLESYKNGYCFADIRIIHGSFLDTTISEWEDALSRADLCICNNVNWEKGAKARPVPRHQQTMTSGESRNRINVNVAQLLVARMKYDSHVLVFDITSFTTNAYQKVSTLSLPATWNTIATQEVCILQMRPTNFKVLKEALRTLCQAKKCNFENLPREWWQNEVYRKGHAGFLRLKDHVLERDYFEKSNASVHFGWSVSPPRKVCIKQFPTNTQDAYIQQEIRTLVRVAQNDDTTTNSVIRYYGAEPDRHGGTVLIFELVHASSITNTISDLQTMTRHQMAEYMYKLLQALNYLHRYDIVHRDVKPANFLHNFESKTFRLIDFGSAETGTKGFVRKGGGTRGFRAPETLIGMETQTAAVDVWSAGIILLSLITGKRYILTQHGKNVKGEICDAEHLKEIEMIVGKTEMQQLHGQQCDTQGDKSLGEQCEKQRDGIEHEKQTGWAAKALQSSIPERSLKKDDQVLDLLSKMLNVQPSKRITSADAIEHPFFVSAGFCKRP